MGEMLIIKEEGKESPWGGWAGDRRERRPWDETPLAVEEHTV